MRTARWMGVAGLAVALLAGGPALATGNPGMTGQMDNARLRDWLGTLHAGNQLEIEAARLALERSTDPQVKHMAQLLLNDHTDLDRRGAALARERNIDLAKSSSSWESAKQRAELQQLKRKSGADFDRAYAALTVSDHQQDLKDVTAMRDRTPDRDPQVKELFSDVKDRIQHHLDMAHGTQQALNERQSSTRQGRRP